MKPMLQENALFSEEKHQSLLFFDVSLHTWILF